ncbi:DEAD/DEAH box helicase [Legionella rowbothamii]|uniref:DEAD/DEAH box helicase n=1 Tax=Legionella rowbothamii TaxID=96229 RepID=UPI0010564D1F|nr:DEAD/DEAH box helicase family protein [Legionella rowbothamii]
MIINEVPFTPIQYKVYNLINGNEHAQVEKYREENVISAVEIARLYMIANNLKKVEEYRTQHNISVNTIAQWYAKVGHHEKVEEYRSQYGASLTSIIQGYIRAKKYDKVEEYRAQHNISVNTIVYWYAQVGNHEKVEEYRSQYGASLNSIIQGYINAKNYDKVEEYRAQHNISVNTIVYWYAQVGNHEKVEEYRTQHNISVNTIVHWYAQLGNHEKVEEYRSQYGASLNDIIQGYINAKNYDKVEEYRAAHNISEHDIAVGYAIIGNHEKVEEYRSQYGASLNHIIQGYINAKNYDKVEEYRAVHNISEHDIARWYALVGNHEKVEEYRSQYGASPSFIIQGYIKAKNYDKVEEYRTRYNASVNEIACGYAAANNHKKVEEYFTQHHASAETIIKGYTFTNNQEKVKEYQSRANVHAESQIKGGIHSKYIAGPLSRLPQPLHSSTTPPRPVTECSFEQISNLPSMSFSHNITTIDLNIKTLEASFITLNQTTPEVVQWTFICAGRKTNALIPLPHNKGGCVLICTEDESKELKPYVSPNLHLLVIKRLDSKYYGHYESLGSITARRIALFLYAHHFKLEEFVMLDDNIQKISWNPSLINGNTWDDAFTFLQTELGPKGCISVATMNGRSKNTGELGSKLFMINMKLIREVLIDNEDIFLLFPDASHGAAWGEDYYFQIFLHHLLKEKKCPGYEIMPTANIGLFRSQKNKNAFAATGKKAEKINGIAFIDGITEQLLELVEKTKVTFNGLIESNYKRYAQQAEFIQNTDLLSLHAQANNRLRTSTVTASASENNGQNFKERFYTLINEYDFNTSVLRPYQVEAVHNVPILDKPVSRLVMATGSGKSIIQATLALFAYHASAPNQHVFIITPQIDLVIQFYEDLMKYNQSLTDKHNSLSIPAQAIVTVSSHAQSLSAKSLLTNNHFRQQRSITICCADSFSKLMEEKDGALVRSASLILLDEYHEYASMVEKVRKLGGPQLIASSATPPKDDIIKDTVYSFTLEDALNGEFHAGIITGKFNRDYSTENVKYVIKCLPQILKTEYHPGFGDSGPLAKSKGIIYLESIELCDYVKKVLDQQGITAYAIHSSNGLASTEVKNFIASTNPGVLLAVRKLRFGFDCPDLAWQIIARKPSQKEPQKDIEQMLGRVIRRYEDKIGYVLTFNDIYKKYLSPLISKQNKVLAVEPDFLAHDLLYRINALGFCQVIDMDVEAPPESTSIGFFSTRKRKHEEDREEDFVRLRKRSRR